ncbi:MAG: response regulator transcription factor [Christensenellales bacterium]
MSKKKIMVIEDDIDLSRLIEMYLIPEGWEVSLFFSGKEALTNFCENEYDLILLDLLLPDINGFEVCKIIRQTSTIPIIMLTALEDPIHRVQGLTIGADDYVIKPFEPSELIARIKSQFRRAYQYNLQDEVANNDIERKSDNLRINKKTHKAYYKGNEIILTPTEFDILWLLMEDPSKIYGMEEIHFKVWGDVVLENETNPVMVHIRRIRKKFEEIGVDSIIKTVWGVGYKINE